MIEIMAIWAPVVAAIVVAIVECIAAKDRRHASAEREATQKRAELRAEESRLSMDMISASVDLGVANSIAILEGRTNGEMKHARAAAEDAQKAYRAYIRKLASDRVGQL